MISKLYSDLHKPEQTDIESLTFILCEILKKSTTGNFIRSIICFILKEEYLDFLLFIDNSNSNHFDSKIKLSKLEVISAVMSFYVAEEVRNSYKSPFVNYGIDECEDICQSFENKFLNVLPNLIEWLTNQNDRENIKNSCGMTIKTFGLARLKLLEILVLTLQVKNNKFMISLVNCDIFGKLFVLNYLLIKYIYIYFR